jgi:hypothetical protein
MTYYNGELLRRGCKYGLSLLSWNVCADTIAYCRRLKLRTFVAELHASCLLTKYSGLYRDSSTTAEHDEDRGYLRIVMLASLLNL